jgi:hypothetical protein
MRIDEVEQLDEYPFQNVGKFGWKSLIPFTGDRSARMATNAAEKQANAKIKYFADKNTATWMTKLVNLKASKPTITPVEIAKSFKAYAALANGGKPVTGIAIPDPSNGKLVLEFFKTLGSKLLSSAPSSTKPKKPKVPLIASVTPNTGPSVGGTTVTIKGRNFVDTKEVKFGATPASSFSVTKPDTIVAVSPSMPGMGYGGVMPTGDADIIIVTASGSSVPSATSKFTYT